MKTEGNQWALSHNAFILVWRKYMSNTVSVDALVLQDIHMQSLEEHNNTHKSMVCFNQTKRENKIYQHNLSMNMAVVLYKMQIPHATQ